MDLLDTARVISVIQFTAAAWLVWVVVDTLVLRKHAREITNARDVDPLREELNTHLAGTSPESCDTVLQQFCAAASVQAAGPIGRHLAAVFEAGWHNTKLDVSALIALSTQRLLRTTAFLQTILGLFLVLGLFGTLLGLRDELLEGNLQQLIASGGDSLEARTRILAGLVGGLGQAFQPSLWGVGVTAFGIVVMSLRTRLVATALQQQLESATLTVWVPAFLPNAPQQLDRILQRIAQQVETSGTTVKEVDGLTTRLQERSKEWLGIVEVATAQMKQMGETAQQFEAATTQFTAGVTRFDDGQEAFTQTFRNFSTENAAMRTWLQEESQRATQAQAAVLQSITEQRETLTAAFQSLKLYEEEYISQRSAIEEAVRENLAATTHVLETSEAQATRIVTELAEPLKSELSARLDTLTTTSHAALANITHELQQLGRPLSEAAKELDNVLHQMERQFATSNKRMADEFRKQTNEVVSQNTNTADQTKELIAQRKVLDALLQKTSELVTEQTSRLQKLLEAIEKLSKQLQRVTVVGPWKAVTDVVKSLKGSGKRSNDK